MRNIAQISRREFIAHRTFDVGMTASAPVCKIMDAQGNKAWVVDVYTGPAIGTSEAILKDVLIASTARQLIGDIRQPVRLERSKQGKYSVVGRSEIIPAGAQMPSGSILEPTYHETKVNLTDLGLLFLADLDYEISGYGEGDYGDVDYCVVRAWDAWGHQVFGPEVDPSSIPIKLSPLPSRTVTTRHLLAQIRPYGDGGYGSGDYAGTQQTTLEITE